MAFLQSNAPRQPMFRAPSVVLWLIAGLAVLHLARISLPGGQPDALVDAFGLHPIRYSQPLPLWEQAVPFLSYMGLHNDWTHLIINCFWLLAFGPIVARRFGSALFFVFFAVCGVIGAAIYLAFNWGSPVPVVGASGAISGLMAAALRMLPGQTPWALPGETPLAPLFSRQILIFTALWAGINLLTGLTGLGMGGADGLIAWQAHLGGFAAGLLLSSAFDSLRPRAVGAPVDR